MRAAVVLLLVAACSTGALAKSMRAKSKEIDPLAAAAAASGGPLSPDVVEKAAERDLKRVEEEDAAASDMQRKMDLAMKHHLEMVSARARAESMLQQEMLEREHKSYMQIVRDLATQLDQTLDAHEAQAEATVEARKLSAQNDDDKQRMLVQMQAECAFKVKQILNDVYETADALVYGHHMRRKSRAAQRMALDKSIDAAREASDPKIGFDMGNEIAKAVDAAREHWLSVASAHAFDAAVNPAQARAEHMFGMAQAQQRQCMLLSLGDVEDIISHRDTVLQFAGAPVLDPTQPLAGPLGLKVPVKHPRDPCMWSVSPSMSVKRIADHILACREAREHMDALNQQWAAYGAYSPYDVDAYYGGAYPAGYPAAAAYGAYPYDAAAGAMYNPYAAGFAVHPAAASAYYMNAMAGAGAYYPFTGGRFPQVPQVGPTTADALALAAGTKVPPPAAGAGTAKADAAPAAEAAAAPAPAAL